MVNRFTLQNGGSVVTLVFGGGLFQVESLWALRLCVYDGMRFHPGKDVVSSGDDGGCHCEGGFRYSEQVPNNQT
jgi:hypothetical protein